MDFKEYAQKELLKEAYGDDNSKEELNLKNSKSDDALAKEYSTEESDEDDMEEAPDSELEEEVFALQSQCDGVTKALETLQKMLNEGPEWALNKVNSFMNQFEKFQQNLTRDEKSQDKKVGYNRVKDIKDESKDSIKDDTMKESFLVRNAKLLCDGPSEGSHIFKASNTALEASNLL
jgi:hypothetical protein